jgi:hypothetical protein
MIKKVFYRTRKDGVSLYRIYSDTTPTIKQQPTGVIYECWVYKLDEEGNLTTEVDFENSGVIDVENAPYTYMEIIEVVQNEENINK